MSETGSQRTLGDESSSSAAVFTVRRGLAEPLGMNLSQNLVINNVGPGSPADKAGIRALMRVVAFNGTPCTTLNELKEHVSGAGAEFQLTAVNPQDESDDDSGSYCPSDVTYSSMHPDEPAAVVVTIHLGERGGATGLRLAMEASSLVVAQVDASSPAAMAGLQVGMHVLSVNGTPATLVSSVESAERALASQDGEVTLSVIPPRRSEQRDSTSTASLSGTAPTATTAAPKGPGRVSKMMKKSPLTGLGSMLSGTTANLTNLGGNLKKAGGTLLGSLGGNAKFEEVVPILGTKQHEDDATTITTVSVEGLVRARKEMVVARQQVIELLKKHRKNEEESGGLTETMKVLRTQSDGLETERRTSATVINRSKLVEAEAAQVDTLLRELDVERDTEFERLQETQSQLKNDLKQFNRDVAALRERADEQGLSLEEPSSPASPNKNGFDTEEAEAERAEAEKLNSLIDAAKQTLVDMEQRHAALQKRLKVSRLTTQATASELQQLAEQEEEMQTQIASVRDVNTAHHDDRKQISQQIQDEARLLERTVEEMMDKVRSAGAARERHLAEASERLQKVQEEESAVTSKLQSVEAEVDALKKANRAQSQQNCDSKQRESEHLALISELTKEGAELEDAQMKCESVEKERDERQASVELCLAQHAALVKQCDDLTEEVATLTTELDSVSARILSEDTCNEKKATRLDEIAERMQELDPLESRITQLQAQLEEEQERLDTERDVCLSLISAVEEEERLTHAAAERQAGLEGEVAQIEVTMADSGAQADELAARFEAIVKEHHMLYQAREAEHADVTTETNHHIKALQQRLAETEGMHKSALTKIDRLESRLRDPRRASGENSVDSIRAENEQLMLQVSELQGRLRTAELGKKAAKEALVARQRDSKKKDELLAMCEPEDRRMFTTSPYVLCVTANGLRCELFFSTHSVYLSFVPYDRSDTQWILDRHTNPNNLPQNHPNT